MTVSKAAGIARVVAVAIPVSVHRGCTQHVLLSIMAEYMKPTAAIIFFVLAGLAFRHRITHNEIADPLIEFVIRNDLATSSF